VECVIISHEDSVALPFCWLIFDHLRLYHFNEDCNLASAAIAISCQQLIRMTKYYCSIYIPLVLITSTGCTDTKLNFQ